MSWDEEKETFAERPDVPANQKITSTEWNEHVSDQKDHSSRHEETGSDSLGVFDLVGSLTGQGLERVGDSLQVLSSIWDGENITANVDNESVNTERADIGEDLEDGEDLALSMGEDGPTYSFGSDGTFSAPAVDAQLGDSLPRSATSIVVETTDTSTGDQVGLSHQAEADRYATDDYTITDDDEIVVENGGVYFFSASLQLNDVNDDDSYQIRLYRNNDRKSRNVLKNGVGPVVGIEHTPMFAGDPGDAFHFEVGIENEGKVDGHSDNSRIAVFRVL